MKNIFKYLTFFKILFLLSACIYHQKAIKDSIPNVESIDGVQSIKNYTEGNDKIYYLSCQSLYIQSKDMPSMIAQAKYLLNHPRISVLIIGDTIDTGSPEYDFVLGWQYAQAAANIFLEQGVLPNKINVISYGGGISNDLWHNKDTKLLNNRVILHYYENS